jgi:hypothetical protein
MQSAEEGERDYYSPSAVEEVNFRQVLSLFHSIYSSLAFPGVCFPFLYIFRERI